MRSIPFCFAALFGLIVSHVHFASAYPNGAGTCSGGRKLPTVLNSESPHGKEDEGKWDESGYEVTVDLTTVPTTVTLEATGSSNFFRGFLFRLNDVDGDGGARGAMKRHDKFKSDSQLLESTSESTGNPATCMSRVVGISHTDNSKKTTMKVHLLLEQIPWYELELMVVKKKNLWYYTSLNLKFDRETNSTGVYVWGNNTVPFVIGSKTSSENISPTASPTAQETVASTATSASEAGATSMGRDAGDAAKTTACQSSPGAVNGSPIVILATCFLIVATCLSL